LALTGERDGEARRWKSLGDSGLEVLKETPEQFRARMRRDYDRFRDIVKAANLKPE
jgi:hypothetical protein